MKTSAAAAALLLGGALALPSNPSSTSSPCTTLTTQSVWSSVYTRVPTTSASTSSRASTTSSASTPTSSVDHKAGRSERCAKNDRDIWTKENWNADGRDMTQWYNDWYEDNIKGSARIDETFASYWGLGPGFDCEITDTCQVPQCSELIRPDQAYDYEPAAMFLASMVNFHRQYHKMYEALDSTKANFSVLQESLEQTFYPGKDPARLDVLEGLNAALTVIGLVSAWAGDDTRKWANTAKEIMGGVYRGVAPTLTAADRSNENLADMEKVYGQNIDKVRDVYTQIHDDVLKWGVTEWTMIDQIFEDGAFVDDREIPILQELSVSEVGKYANDLFFAMVISNAWVKQGAYIFSREMSEEDCNSYDISVGESTPSPVCYDGRIYFLNKYLGYDNGNGGPGVSPLPGWGELEEQVGASVEDVILSSVDAYNMGGYTYKSDDHIDEIFDGDIEKKVAMGSRYPGIWNIPVCELERSEQYDKIPLTAGGTSDDWQRIDKGKPPHGQDFDGIQPCLCATTTDRNGVSIKELDNPGKGSFRAILNADEHKKCTFPNGIA